MIIPTILKKEIKQLKAPKKLKTVLDKKEPMYEQINKYLKSTNFNGTVAVLIMVK